MHYKLIFDAAQTEPHWQYAAFGLIFIVIGSVFFFFPNCLPRWSKEKTRRFGIFYLGFSLLWTANAAWSVFSQYFEAKSAVEHNTFHVVEGQVEKFKPMPVSGHQMESFDVKGKHFEYSDYVISAGFSNTTSHGGPIHEGLPVRIGYTGDDTSKLLIVKLEVPE